ncbi:MAG: hypothetical protein PHI11_09380 [Gallionella sp.]|nr:hypothetical protein [Gallionella sp.]
MNDTPEATQDDVLDFTDAGPVDTPPTPFMQDKAHCMTLWIDTETQDFFNTHAELSGTDPQTLMAQTLRQHAQGQTLVEVIREAIREELRTDAHQQV